MKRFALRYLGIPVLCMLLLLTGCTLLSNKPAENNDNNEQILAQLNAMKAELNVAKAELAAIKNGSDTGYSPAVSSPTAKPEPEVIEEKIPVEFIVAKNCTVNGKQSVRVEGETEIHAVADSIDGYVFDHWVVDGDRDDSGPDANFVLSYPAVVAAIFRPRRIVTFVGCHMTLLDKKGNSVGSSYTSFDFEDDYRNPETKETVPGGTIGFYVFADIPKGMEVDYWLINGVKYEMPYNNITKFRVEMQTEKTDYEVVFRKETPKKQCNILTENCWFSGGSYSNATHGVVPEGTKITVTGRVSKRSAVCGYFEGSPSDVGRGSASSPLNYSWYDDTYYYFSYSYTVKSDTMIIFHPVFGAG